MKVLIAEDDSVLADGLSRSLRNAGYSVECAVSGTAADAALVAQQYDVVILDLGLPKMSGLEVLRRLRGRDSKVPVLILTAADSIEQRVRGLDLGADDFMAKPFALSELEARVRALVRRMMGGSASLFKLGPLAYDQAGRTAQLNGQPLELSARELGLLEILMQRVGRLVSKEQIVEHMCGCGDEVSYNAVEVYMHRLRRKLEGGGIRIATVRGLGYCLQRPPETVTGT
jgi:two-component system, OmpR family, response regulator